MDNNSAGNHHTKTKPTLFFLQLSLALLMAVLLNSNLPSAAWASDESGSDILLPVVIKLPYIGPAVPNPAEWTQDAHDPQRTGYSTEEPVLPWTLLWTWNGPDPDGGPGGHFYHAPREARTVTGGSWVFVPAGNRGLYALSKTSGEPAWHLQDAGFEATPAYDPNRRHLLAGGTDGRLYKIEAHTGMVSGTYQAGSPIHKSVLLVGEHAYIVTLEGRLHKVNIQDMTRSWTYDAGSPISTPPAYSASRGLVVFASEDLHIHAVQQATGTQHWRVKPTSRPAKYPYSFDGYWPVVADGQGIVFVRLNLGMNALWSGPLTGEWGGGIYPFTNAEIRDFLQSEGGKWKNLFALDLDNGQEKFVPAVGFGGVEGLKDDKPVLENGPVPVVRVLPDGKEVAYTHFRSGQGGAKDGRWDSHIGEMVLDNSSVPGMAAGDLRFINTANLQTVISDEQTPLTGAGDTLFHAHWGASESFRITDRSDARGKTFENPILTLLNPTVIRRIVSCASFDPTTHWTSCGLSLFGDTRYWSGPGWWVYWNVLDPPTPPRQAYSEGILPRYTYVSDGLVIVEGNGGELFVLKHSGR